MATFNIETFQGFLTASKIGKKLIYEEVTGSTMDDARRLAHNIHENPHGTAVMSERQTKARGAKDHKWDASNTGNIYVSFILHLPPAFKTYEGRFDLEVAACLAVLQVAHKLGVTHAIPKWPNDIWVKGHKLAGFLVEDGRFEVPGSLNCLLILGMGINVNADVRRNPELHSIATSLLCEREGVSVNREEFFADVCSTLEATLSRPRDDLLAEFRRANLFQRHDNISVSCLIEGNIIDGEFLKICENWDVKLIDKVNGETRNCSSQNFTIRPKVVNKIIVVSTGIQSNKSAANLSQWLLSIVDTSKFVVCLVPESSITNSDVWMKTCSLLVLAENICEPDSLSSKVSSFLKSGGSVMSNGMGSLFLAKVLDVPLKEVLLDSADSITDVGHVHLQVQVTVESTKNIPHPLVDSKQFSTVMSSARQDVFIMVSSSVEPVIFPTTPVCFQFFEDEKALLSESHMPRDNLANKETVKSPCFENEPRPESTNAKEEGKCEQTQLKAFYVNIEENNKTLAVFTLKIQNGGNVALWGFDAGIMSPSTQEEVSGVKSHVESDAVHMDRFKRDKLLSQVLDILLK
ncbi:unnamed protein product [Lymnaea stagnalis]|uniref:BPL/LPL catalytic domain-containing protein n=1 Tax=Lymnaea stagnalis TaxID=6523 RepID=A0AAV2HQK4_LYMST